MEIFLKELKDVKALVFLDLEATAFTSEMIEIGAYLATIDSKGRIKKVFKPFKHYVKAHHRIGYPVTQLTGITEEKIAKDGEEFEYVLSEFRRYVGRYWSVCKFVTFGEHDIVIIKSTMSEHRNMEPTYARNIYRHHLDLQRLLSTYVQDEHGNPYSLKNYLSLFDLEFDGQQHDAAFDALNLLDLYKKAVYSPNIFVESYKKTLLNVRNNPIARELIKKLNNGETVTPEYYEELLERTFK